MKRITPLDGVHNFRHWFGYKSKTGKFVQPGLYRSGHFARSSSSDRTFFDELGLSVVVDMRRPRERAREPSPWLYDQQLRVISSSQDDHSEPPHMRFLREGNFSSTSVRDYMLSAYRRIPMEEGNKTALRDGIRALASGDADGGLLVHCAAGKDRTGIFCALVLDELGVSRSDIFEDYLLTNSAVDFEVLVPLVQQTLKDNIGVDVPDNVMRAFLGVDVDYLAEAFAVMGGTDAYLTEKLGISDAERESLRDRWLGE
jgi:protein-tyrosine phosphatase